MGRDKSNKIKSVSGNLNFKAYGVCRDNIVNEELASTALRDLNDYIDVVVRNYKRAQYHKFIINFKGPFYSNVKELLLHNFISLVKGDPLVVAEDGIDSCFWMETTNPTNDENVSALYLFCPSNCFVEHIHLRQLLEKVLCEAHASMNATANVDTADENQCVVNSERYSLSRALEEDRLLNYLEFLRESNADQQTRVKYYYENKENMLNNIDMREAIFGR